MTLENIVPVLQLSIGPVIVISGAGLVLLSMTNRYSGVVTRFRVLAESMKDDGHGDTTRIRRQLGILFRRARLLRMAIAWVTTSLLLAALLVIALFLMAILQSDHAAVVIALFIACMGSLILGLIVFLVDVNLSLGALQLQDGIGRDDHS